MYAVIKTGGKQYRVTKGDRITVERLEAEAGKSISISEVVMVGDKVGTPFVSGASVKATIVEHNRGDKIIVFKKKRRHNYRRKKGHKQHHTVLEITDVAAG